MKLLPLSGCEGKGVLPDVTGMGLDKIVSIDSVKVRELPDKDVKMHVFSEMILFVDSLSKEAGLTVEKCHNIVDLFVRREDVKNMGIGQLAYFLRNAFDFKYGETYGGFGYDTLVKWWRAFLDEKKEAVKKPGRLAESSENVSLSKEELERTYCSILANGPVLFFPWAKYGEICKAEDPDGFSAFNKKNGKRIGEEVMLAAATGARESGIGLGVGRLLNDAKNSIGEEILREYGKKLLTEKFKNENDK